MKSRLAQLRAGRTVVAVLAAAAVLSPVAANGQQVPAPAVPGSITTFAGGGQPKDHLGDGLLATRAGLPAPWGVAQSGGSTYISTGGAIAPGRVRKVLQDGTIATFAGGSPTPVGDGGPALSAILFNPKGVTVDSAGNLLIADTSNHRIRKVDAGGTISTVAGTGIAGFGGDGGPATAALLSSPETVLVDAAGNLIISDTGNSRIRKVSPAGVISTIAGTGAAGFGGDGGQATAAQFDSVRNLALDGSGNLYLADFGNHRIRRIDGAGVITTYAGTGSAGYSGDGAQATAAELNFPSGVTYTAAGLVIADELNQRLRRVDGTGVISTIAGTGAAGYGGDGGSALAAQLNLPTHVSSDSTGRLFVSDGANQRMRQIDTGGTIATVAGTGTAGYSGDGAQATAAEFSGVGASAPGPGGTLYISDIANARIRRVNASGVVNTVAGGGVGDGQPALKGTLNDPRGIALDAAGNLLIADCNDRRLRKVDTSGVISTVAGGGQPADGVGDGEQATASALRCPSGVAVVTSGPALGTIYIADSGSHRVRKIDPSGVITTAAGTGVAGYNGDGISAVTAQLRSPSGVGFDTSGNLLIADTDNHRVRRVDAGSAISTVAGNGTQGYGKDGLAATAVPVTNPTGTAVDASGNLFIAESHFARVRKVTGGVISTVAGLGVPAITGDGGPAAAATVDLPTNLALDSSGNLYVTDLGNNRVRRIASGASPPLPASGCGQLVMQSITLTRSIGPCKGDGLVIGADNVTVNLNGFAISGHSSVEGTNIGIRMVQRSGVTVTGGTVSGFDAGIALIGGSGNTVTHVTAQDNLGPRQLDVAVFSDGIVAFFSSDNVFSNNLVSHNGSYDGMAILGIGADRNLVQGNTIEKTVMRGEFGTAGTGIIISPFLGFSLPREVSLFQNRVVGNVIRDNDNSGSSTLSNVGGEVSGNVVTGNGLAKGTFPGNGLGVQHLQFALPGTQDLIRDNQVHGNGGSGIFVSSQNNRILDNDAANNHAVAGLEGDDLHDDNPDCDTNVWLRNVWGSGGFSPPCVTTDGHQAAAPAVASAPLAAAAASPALPAVTPASPADSSPSMGRSRVDQPAG